MEQEVLQLQQEELLLGATVQGSGGSKKQCQANPVDAQGLGRPHFWERGGGEKNELLKCSTSLG